MTDKQKERIKKLGLNVEDFFADEEKTTIEDLVEALDILASIVLGGEE